MIPEMKLQIDPEFELYLRPLSPDEFQELEADVLEKGCQNPIRTWHNFIVDGHNRYRICLKHGIPFNVEPIDETKYKEKLHVLIWMDQNELAKGRTQSLEEKVRIRTRLIENTWEAGWKIKDFQQEIADALGISQRTVARIQEKDRAIKSVDPEIKTKLPESKLETMGYKAVKSFSALSKPEQQDVIDRTGADPKAIEREMARRRKPLPAKATPVVGDARPENTKPTKQDVERAAKAEPTKLGQDALLALGELNKRLMTLKKHLPTSDYQHIRQHMTAIDERLVDFVNKLLESQGVEVDPGF